MNATTREKFHRLLDTAAKDVGLTVEDQIQVGLSLFIWANKKLGVKKDHAADAAHAAVRQLWDTTTVRKGGQGGPRTPGASSDTATRPARQ